ncbi:MAG: 50S ribosomal protein L9 [Deltaproteobacteria bacterium]|nr:50S ribosomal protein L9 [Deltaproteobacteria bacterium]
MKVILKDDVSSLGKAGDAVNVSDGFGRNYLIPRGMAIEASTKNMKALEQEKKAIYGKVEKERQKALSLQERLAATTISIAQKVGENDKLFGSVTAKDIESALAARGIAVDRKKIIIGDPIKAIGTYQIKIKLHSGVTAEVALSVVGEN